MSVAIYVRLSAIVLGVERPSYKSYLRLMNVLNVRMWWKIVTLIPIWITMKMNYQIMVFMLH